MPMPNPLMGFPQSGSALSPLHRADSGELAAKHQPTGRQKASVQPQHVCTLPLGMVLVPPIQRHLIAAQHEMRGEAK